MPRGAGRLSLALRVCGQGVDFESGSEGAAEGRSRAAAAARPEVWFEDFGAAKLKRGRVIVKLDADFAKLIKRGDYKVYAGGRLPRAPRQLEHVFKEPHYLRTGEASKAGIIDRIGDEEMTSAWDHHGSDEETRLFERGKKRRGLCCWINNVVMVAVD